MEDSGFVGSLWIRHCIRSCLWQRGKFDVRRLDFGAGLVFLLVFFLLLRLRAGDDHVASHERLVIEHFHAADGIFPLEHFDEAIAFGAMGATVVDDFDIAHGSDSFEEFLEVLFGNVVGQVADINTAGLDGGGVSAALAFFVTVVAAIAVAAGPSFLAWFVALAANVAGIGFWCVVGLGGFRA